MEGEANMHGQRFPLVIVLHKVPWSLKVVAAGSLKNALHMLK